MAWIDADQDADQIRDEIAAMLARSPVEDAEEYAIHDFEGFEGITISEYAGIDTWRGWPLSSQSMAHSARACWSSSVGDMDQAETALQDCYHGQYASLADYMEE